MENQQAINRFEVRTRDEADLTYSIWDHDMQAWKYVYEWDGTKTISLIKANEIAEQVLNKK